MTPGRQAFNEYAAAGMGGAMLIVAIIATIFSVAYREWSLLVIPVAVASGIKICLFGEYGPFKQQPKRIA